MTPRRSWTLWLAIGLAAVGCCHPKVTAVPLSAWNRDEPEGIPYYLPKPLLIIAKNFRYVEEAKVGLTDGAPIPNSFDDQGKYADLNARTNLVPPEASGAGNSKSRESDSTTGPAGSGTASGQNIYSTSGAPVSPREAPGDGLTPDTFYTYQIVFVPDLSQKYGLRIKGGAGEIRAAMNLVNGWQFTGLGPYYMKDSSTAQNLMAAGIFANLTGRAVADVVKSLEDLRGKGTAEAAEVVKALGDIKTLTKTYNATQPGVLCNYAEIHVLEPHLTADGDMEWREIAGYNLDREYLGTATTTLASQGPEALRQLAELERAQTERARSESEAARARSQPQRPQVPEAAPRGEPRSDPGPAGHCGWGKARPRTQNTVVLASGSDLPPGRSNPTPPPRDDYDRPVEPGR